MGQVPDDAVSALLVAWNWSDSESLSVDALSNSAAAQSPAEQETGEPQVSVLVFIISVQLQHVRPLLMLEQAKTSAKDKDDG